jgi:quercetin dioxygenase-like cupin family protein
MEKIVNPTVTILATGASLIAKQMQANAGDALPIHHASVESIVFIYKGQCIFRMNGEELLLKPGEAIAIPPFVKHQIKAISNFKGIHFMPKDIKFEFFTE